MKKLFIAAAILILSALTIAAIIRQHTRETTQTQPSPLPTSPPPLAKIIIHSDSFTDNGKIPAKYTCDGENISPQLSFANIPPEAKSLVLVVDDPDAPGGTFTHWILYNIDPSVTSLTENDTSPAASPGLNSYGSTSYRGPCPPKGTIHRYFFKLYALSTILPPFKSIPSKAELEFATADKTTGFGLSTASYQRRELPLN